MLWGLGFGVCLVWVWRRCCVVLVWVWRRFSAGGVQVWCGLGAGAVWFRCGFGIGSVRVVLFTLCLYTFLTECKFWITMSADTFEKLKNNRKSIGPCWKLIYSRDLCFIHCFPMFQYVSWCVNKPLTINLCTADLWAALCITWVLARPRAGAGSALAAPRCFWKTQVSPRWGWTRMTPHWKIC